MGALATLAGTAAIPRAAAAAEAVRYPVVQAGTPLVFPRDHGAHPAHRIEWWYVTGWLDPRDAGGPLGVQITFFRLRPGIDESPALFAPRQLLFAHAALADPAEGRLLHDERAARAGLGLATASEATTDVSMGDWRFALDGPARYVTRIPTRAFTLELAFEARTPILLQGDAGYSRKGPLPQQASHYYSRPHLAVSGRVVRGDRPREVGGIAWLDHEWSSEVMAPDAQGWDWTGINFDDGSALMAFRMRSRSGGLVWSAATLRTADGRVRTYRPEEIRFEPLRTWTSPRTNARYPVAMRVTVGDRIVTLAPLFDDQELDSRASTGTVYWEGAVRAHAGAGADGAPVGRGYLELTGYQRRLVL
jgi:predicted secreted hydrolase